MTEDRFWSRVAKGRPTECWPWLGARTPDGYGVVRVDGQLEYAHRTAFRLTHGSIPVGLSVLHRCDNPPCCNPRCLWAGTQAENLADMAAKGRARNRFSKVAS